MQQATHASDAAGDVVEWSAPSVEQRAQQIGQPGANAADILPPKDIQQPQRGSGSDLLPLLLPLDDGAHSGSQAPVQVWEVTQGQHLQAS